MRLYQDIFNEERHTSTNSLANALLTKPSLLSSTITFLSGRNQNIGNLPLTLMTEGVGNVETIDDFFFEYPVMDSFDKTCTVVDGPTSGAPGIGRQFFYLTFPDRWFQAGYTIVSESGVYATIHGEPEQVSTGYKYKMRILHANPNMYMPLSDCASGARFASMYRLVGVDFSRGSTSSWVAPSRVRHAIATLRKGYSMSGNAAVQKVTSMELQTDQGKIELWSDFEEWQHMMKWKEECENYYTYGVQTYDENGVVQLKDENGQPLLAGPGLLEQIPNKDTYTYLTENKIKNTVRNLFYGMSDGDNRVITLMTGTGGRDEFDRAMKGSLVADGYRQFNDKMFVSGSGRNLQLSGFFSSYQHVDGHVVNVVYNPAFDRSGVARASKRHPKSNLPLESYRMVFLDTSSYDGQSNLVMVQKRNREMLRWAVAGSTVPKGFKPNDTRANDIDGASVHFMKVAGICLRRFTTSLDLTCVAE
jgi:hypothetical protein